MVLASFSQATLPVFANDDEATAIIAKVQGRLLLLSHLGFVAAAIGKCHQQKLVPDSALLRAVSLLELNLKEGKNREYVAAIRDEVLQEYEGKHWTKLCSDALIHYGPIGDKVSGVLRSR